MYSALQFLSVCVRPLRANLPSGLVRERFAGDNNNFFTELLKKPEFLGEKRFKRSNITQKLQNQEIRDKFRPVHNRSNPRDRKHVQTKFE